MLPDKSTPPQAETDLPLGRARIPANWSLQLVLYVATRVCVQRAASHSLTHLNPLFTRTPQNIRNFLVVDDDGNILQVS